MIHLCIQNIFFLVLLPVLLFRFHVILRGQVLILPSTSTSVFSLVFRSAFNVEGLTGFKGPFSQFDILEIEEDV